MKTNTFEKLKKSFSPDSIKWLFCIVLLVNQSVFAQKKEVYDPTKLFSVEQVKADVLFLKNALNEAHPGYTWYASRDSLNKVFDDFSASIDAPMTERTFRNRLFPVVAQVRCGHSTLSNSKERTNYLKKAKVKYIPLDLAMLEGRLYVKDNYSKDSTIAPMTEVLAVEDVATADIANTFVKGLVTDGYNETHQTRRITNHFQLQYVRFFEEKDKYELQLRDTLGKIRIVKLDALDVVEFPFRKGDRKSNAKPIYTNKKINTFTLDTENPKIAVLKIKAFTPFKFWKLYRKSFKYIEKNNIEHLVLDMRDNGGGMIFHPGHLLSYLINERETIHMYRENKKPSFVNQTSNKWKSMRITERFFPKIPKRWGVKTNKTDSLYEIFATNKIRKKNHYNGKLYVLTNGNSFSATSLTAAFLKKNNRATFIGEETGGGEAGCNAMVTTQLILPNSHLEYRFPYFRVMHMGVKPAQKGRGIMPDFPIKYSPKEFIADRDLEMELVRKMVKGK